MERRLDHASQALEITRIRAARRRHATDRLPYAAARCPAEPAGKGLRPLVQAHAAEYAKSVLNEPAGAEDLTPENDPNLVAIIKHFRSLISLAQEARKPIFSLTPADGAMGAHSVAANAAYGDFKQLALELLRRMGPPARHPAAEGHDVSEG